MSYIIIQLHQTVKQRFENKEEKPEEEPLPPQPKSYHKIAFNHVDLKITKHKNSTNSQFKKIEELHFNKRHSKKNDTKQTLHAIYIIADTQLHR